MSDFTFTFEEIFPDYTTWRGIMEAEGVVDYDDAKQATFDAYCYQLLINYFYGWEIRYSVPESFIARFKNVYRNRFRQFMQQANTVNEIHALTQDDFVLVGEALTNVAENPNTAPNDPYKPLNYISSQQYSRTETNRLDALLRALNSIPNERINEFLRGGQNYRDELGFVDLFVQVIPTDKYFYRR